MPLTIFSFARCYLLCFWPPWDCSQPKHNFQTDLMPCIMMVSLILIFPSSSSNSPNSIIFCTFWLPEVPFSTCLSVSGISFTLLPSILIAMLTLTSKHDLFVTLSSFFLSHCHDTSGFFLTWQINDSPCASRAVSVSGANAQCHILLHLFSNPSSKTIFL